MADFRLTNVESLSFVGSFTFQDEYFSPRAVDATYATGTMFEADDGMYVAKIQPDINCPSYRHTLKVDFTNHLFVQFACMAGCSQRLLTISDSILGADLKSKLAGTKLPTNMIISTTLRNVPSAMRHQINIEIEFTPDRNCHYISEVTIRIPKVVLDTWFDSYLNFRQQIGLKR